jgi:formylglycine-generating enzyme required for sulfatase activity
MSTDRGKEDERPPHRVFVDRFEIAVFPVTRAEYAGFVDATDHEPPRDCCIGRLLNLICCRGRQMARCNSGRG